MGFLQLNGVGLVNSLNVAWMQLSGTMVILRTKGGPNATLSFPNQATANNVYSSFRTALIGLPSGETAQLIAFNPTGSALAGGAAIVLAGVNLLPGSSITINGASATGVHFLGNTTVRFVTPSNPGGVYPVVYVGLDGQRASLPGFTYT